MKIRTQITILALSGVAVLGTSTLLLWNRADRDLKARQDKLVIDQAASVGVSVAAQVAATRGIYTKQIVEKLKPHGVDFNRAPKDGEGPLPAVFMSAVSEKLAASAGENSTTFVLRSGWNINANQGVTTPFEKKGWEFLLAQEKQLAARPAAERQALYKPYVERGEDAKGRAVVNVMTADLASAESCVNCHNALEATPDVMAMRGKAPMKQFALGDLMGAVSTTVPIANSEAIVKELAAAQASVGSQFRWFAIVGGLVLGFLSLYVGARIARPIVRVAGFARTIADGDLTARCEITSRSEVGELVTAMNDMSGKLRDTVRNIRENAQTVASASTELSATACQLTGGAAQTTSQSATVAAASEEMAINMNNMASAATQMSGNVKGVAAAVEEMTASINEITRHTEKASAAAKDASSLANVSNEKISKLGEAADEIGKVVTVIQDIAEQTNLLALNATIEAARAGEAGKGFAVVASEVKELARQTAGATEDIGKRIAAIQATTGESVDAISRIVQAISGVTGVSSTIAAALEEQSVTTKEIAKNMSQTATAAETVSVGIGQSASASKEITRNISGVDLCAKQTAQGATETQQAGERLSGLAESLNSLVSQFKV
ncbi:MAG: DUF3365 domain-containing protein [Phycisphaerales bacterium]|nr:DUF3365 domain-containing protein [Phycisphaerales bacterium]